MILPTKLAISSVLFPAITFSVVWLPAYAIASLHLGLGAVAYGPVFLVLLVALLPTGIVFGILRGIAAIRLARELPLGVSRKIFFLAGLGIVLSLGELAHFAFSLGTIHLGL